MEKILVTGATGFVGSRLAMLLSSRGQHVRITVRNSSDRRNIKDHSIEEVSADILDRTSIQAAVKGCSHVYHVAGLYRSWMRDYQKLFDVNVTGTKNILDACLSEGVEKVVHTSSIGALGLHEDGRLSNEQCPFNLHHYDLPYELSKYQSEVAATAFNQKGLPVVVVRPALVMGEGDVYPTPSGKMVLDIIQRKMPSYFDGAIDVVDVDDVAEGHILAMEKGRAGESYNLGSAKNFTSLKDLFELIAQCAGVKPPGIQVPVSIALGWSWCLKWLADYLTHKEPIATPANIKALAMKKRVDFSKAVNELGIPQTQLKEVIAKTVNWYRNEGFV